MTRPSPRIKATQDGEETPEQRPESAGTPSKSRLTDGKAGPSSPRSPSSPQRIQFEESASDEGPQSTSWPLTSSKRPTSPQIPPPKDIRKSEEFDRRYDGPFALPSSVMSRTSGTFPRLERPSTSRSHRRSLNADLEKEKEASSPAPSASGGEQPPVPTVVFMPEPPRLNYTLQTRKLSILLWWTMIVFDSTLMPIALYFGLWYGVGPGAKDKEKQKLSANAVFSIVTAAIGGASILEYFLRMWSLWKRNSNCRVIGGGRWHLDWFHWNFTVAWLIIMVELVIGSVQKDPRRDPYIRILSMPLATMLYVFGTELLVIDILRYFHYPAPLRISSIPKGAQLRPAIYSLVEDICAVDGSGGTAFREALDRRYEASHVFRAMLRRLGVFWSVGAQATAVVTTILIFTLSKDAAYVVGWTLPFVWAGVWTPATIWYVKRELRREENLWMEDVARKQNG